MGITKFLTMVVPIGLLLWLMYEKYVKRKPFYEWVYDRNHLLFKRNTDLTDFYTTWVTAPKYGINIPRWLIKVFHQECDPQRRLRIKLERTKLLRNY